MNLGMMAFVMLIGLCLALPISFVLIRLYRRAVVKAMRERAGAPPIRQAPAADPTSPAHAPPSAPPPFTVINHESDIKAGPEAEALHAEVLRAPRQAAVVYGVAGACFALMMTAAWLVAHDISFYPMLILMMFVVHAWPIVLTVNLVAAASRGAKLKIGVAYFVILALVTVAGMALFPNPGFNWLSVSAWWLVVNLPPTLLLLTFLNRRVRAVGPLVLIFTTIAVLGSQLALSPLVAMSEDEAALRSVSEGASAVGLGSVGLFVALMLGGVLLLGPAGWLTLRWVRGRYERKKLSDQSVTLDAIWLLYGLFHSMVLATQGPLWLLSIIVAFAGYKVAVRIGFALLGRGTLGRGRTKLLLLRVFSLGKRSERLFDAVAKHWRHVGSIQLIAGPDLATDTVEPHEFMDFVTGKLGSRFIGGPEMLNRSVTEMDVEPDPDGRFRVNDFFCRDDTWKMALSRLVSESDAVLMDLRGFTQSNAGCVYELNELINVVPLRRVGFITDETTDEQFLFWSMRQSWVRMPPNSPNSGAGGGDFRLFRYTGSHGGELRQLLRTLCTAAKTG
jgi:hypothetical protein